ncbi:MAG TPA: hypothetical protein VJ965_04065 [Anaerolineales bacterium]|nr:hypothetical protein [Anaerolineales bacterium]
MLKKIIISVLAITVMGAGAAAAAYNIAQSQAAPTTANNENIVLASNPTQGNSTGQQSDSSMQIQQSQYNEPAAEGLLGDPFEAAGTITAVDLNGVEIATAEDKSIFVELGPQDYLVSQGVELAVGEEVSVSGMVNEDMYHATDLTLRSTGETIVLRSDDGQPMWSGGASVDKGNGSADGSHTPDPQAQVAPDEWVTLTGTLGTLTRSQMTIQLADGTLVAFQSGQPRFFEAQGVVFNEGDEISVVGYWGDNGQFIAGDITQVATGMKVMLRDPNGRPLWAGPGGNGSGNGADNTGVTP